MNPSIPVYNADGSLFASASEQRLARLQSAGLVDRVVRSRKGQVLRAILFTRPGAAESISANPPHQEVPDEFMQTVFAPDALAKFLVSRGDTSGALLDWWKNRLAPEFRKRIQFPSSVAALRGTQTLQRAPQVVVGTIHSVKGGQADVVYLFPDLSKAADAQYRKWGPPRDSVIRTFYVGATRAREILYICSAEGAAAASI